MKMAALICEWVLIFGRHTLPNSRLGGKLVNKCLIKMCARSKVCYAQRQQYTAVAAAKAEAEAEVETEEAAQKAFV